MKNSVRICFYEMIRSIHANEWEEKPQTIAKTYEHDNFKHTFVHMSLIEEKTQKIDASPIKFLVKLDQSYQTQPSCTNQIMISHAIQKDQCWNQRCPSIPHIHKKPK